MSNLGKTILLVEDDAVFAAAEARTLESNGYKVIIVDNGERALQTVLDGVEIDLILMDIQPGRGIDGIEASKLILCKRELPVIFLAALTDAGQAGRCEAIPHFGYVPKNAGETVLLASIKTALRLFEKYRDLAENENKLRTMIDFTSDWEYWIDGEGSFIYTSPSCETITGYSREDFMRDRNLYIEIVHPDDLQLVFDHQKTEALHRDTDSLEFRIITREGATKWLGHRCQGIISDNGAWLGRRASNHDITAQVESKNLLAQTRENYETFFNTIDEFLFVLDAGGNIIHTNSTVLERLGYTTEELLGKSVLMVHPEGRREEAGAIVGAMLAGKADFCPVPIVTKSGVQIPVETRISQGIWNGRPAIFGVTKDISQVQLSEEKFSKLFNLNPSACGLSNLKTGEYVEVNKSFTRLLGYEASEAVGKTAWELGILPEDVKNAILARVDSKGNIYNAEATLTTKNGDKKQVLLSAENIHVQDVQYRFTVVHDISEQKLSESRIQSLLDEKNMLLREVHHRIKNNMGTMMSLLALQAAQTREPGAVEALINAQHRLQSMDVLYDALYRRDNFQEMEIGSYLEPLINRMLSVFPGGESVRTEYSFEVFRLDSRSLSTLGILVNELVTNTMKHAFKGQHEGRIMVSAHRDGSKAFFSYADNGIQDDPSPESKHAAGFGLTLVEMLTKQLGGSMRVHREGGTRYSLEFRIRTV